MLCLSACGGGGGGGSAPQPEPAPDPAPPVAEDACGVEAQKAFVLEVADDWYRWYDEMAVVDPRDFATAQDLLDALTAPLAEDFRDPGFSYVTTITEDRINLSTGAYVGFGFRYAIDEEGHYLISDAFEGGSAFAAGFRRGVELLAVDRGQGFESMRELEVQDASLTSIFGAAEVGLERGFRLRGADSVFEVEIAKTRLDIPALVAAPRTVERSGLPPVAYLHLRRFISSANADLAEAFADFSEQGITDFVIDLRFNSGGSVNVADFLLDLLAGRVADGEIAFRVTHNDKRSSEDTDSRFSARAESVDPLRIAFLTSESTASASELVINSLAPYFDLALIGSDTSGKAVGQYAFDLDDCDTRLRLVTFETQNADGLGGYYTGLADTGRFTLCPVQDSYRGAFGSRDEPLLAAALSWLDEGACGAIGVADTASASRALRRGPGWIRAIDYPDRRSSWVQ
jgi:C-terminal processing protease CtpA/Prc